MGNAELTRGPLIKAKDTYHEVRRWCKLYSMEESILTQLCKLLTRVKVLTLRKAALKTLKKAFVSLASKPKALFLRHEVIKKMINQALRLRHIKAEKRLKDLTHVQYTVIPHLDTLTTHKR